jgi:phosphatidylglycerophosphate synthase
MLVLGRDVLILLMAGYAFFFTSIREFPPSVLGKRATFTLIVTGVAVMLTRAKLVPAEALLPWFFSAATAMTVISGGHYLATGIGRLTQARQSM